MTKDVRKEALCALGEFKEKYPKYDIVLASISGSHSFGWASDKSDIDIRGCYQIPTESFFDDLEESLPDTIEFASKEYDVEFQMHELKKFVGLMIQPNLNILDCVFVGEGLLLEFDNRRYDILKNLGNDSLSKMCYPHVQGMTVHMKKHRNKYNLSDPKKNLYIFRELMRGIVLFEEGVLQNNIHDLLFHVQEYKDPVMLLLKKKKAGEFLSVDEKEYIEDAERKLESRMLQAKEFGTLRITPPDDLNKKSKKFIVNERRRNYEE